MAKKTKPAAKTNQTAPYKHPEAKSLMRPEVETQAQFKKKKAPKTYRYDSSLSPALNWDGKNPAREQGEALIKQVLDAKSLEEAKAAASKLKSLSKPFLNWAGKAERLSFDVPTLPLFIHERLSTKAIIETLAGHKTDKQEDMFALFGDPQHSITDQVLKAYEYQDNWVNRMVLGDSLVVMNSLLHYEGLGGQVQMITLSGPGRVDEVNLDEFRAKRRMQELMFDLAKTIAREYAAQKQCTIPSHKLFPQLANIIQLYLDKKVEAQPPSDKKDLFLAPYYGWVVERLLEAIRPDTAQGEAPEIPRYEATRGPGSTGDVDFWTSRDVREVNKSHLNYVVADTKQWEQSATYYLDKDRSVEAFVKNSGLGFAVPYLHNGQMHDYVPDFIVRLNGESACHLILETKGYDPLEEVKRAAADRWVAAVNADGTHGHWFFFIAKKVSDIPSIIESATGKE